MNDSKISVRYAKALFLSSREKKNLDSIRTDMELILRALEGIPDLGRLLDSPVVEPSRKSAILKQIFKSRVQPETIIFLELVSMKNREEFLPGMARHFIKLYKEEMGIKIATVTTAVAMDDQVVENIRELIRKAFKSEVELARVIREDIIGGFILRVDDQMLDASVSGSLDSIRKELQKK